MSTATVNPARVIGVAPGTVIDNIKPRTATVPDSWDWTTWPSSRKETAMTRPTLSTLTTRGARRRRGARAARRAQGVTDARAPEIAAGRPGQVDEAATTADLGRASSDPAVIRPAAAAPRTDRSARPRLAHRILVSTGWVAVVALGGVSLIPAPEAVAAGITQQNYVIADSTTSASQTTAPLRREV